jgi:hypothetical protein
MVKQAAGHVNQFADQNAQRFIVGAKAINAVASWHKVRPSV